MLIPVFDSLLRSIYANKPISLISFEFSKNYSLIRAVFFLSDSINGIINLQECF